MPTVAEQLQSRLRQRFAPERLAIIDESHHHVGHAGHRREGETHFRIEIVAEAFRGKSRVERQRMVYGAVDDLMRDRIHALALEVRVPGE
jgi:BolA protein